MTVQSGGTAINTIIIPWVTNGYSVAGSVTISSCTTAINTKIRNSAVMVVRSGVVASGIDIENNGKLITDDGAIIVY